MSTTTPGFFAHAYQSLIRFLAHHKTYTAFLFVMIVATVTYGLLSQPKTSEETYIAHYGTLTQYVKVSGSVTASKDANLSFQTIGQVAYVGVTPGDRVPQGKVLATLSSADAQANLLQAQASLSSAQASLEQLQQGARKEEVAVKEQVLANTKNSLDQAYAALPDSIQNVDAVTSDVVKNKFSPFFSIANGRYTLTFTSCDQRLQGELETKRADLEVFLADFQKKSSIITTISSTENVDKAFDGAYQAALKTNDLVNTISNFLLAPCSASNTSLDPYRVTLSVVKTTMTSLFSDITLKRTSLATAKNSYNQAKRDLELTNAGTDPYKIKAGVAQVEQAEALLAQARSGLAKTMITAPFTGVISKVDLSLGETVSLGKTVISMLATDGYEVEAKVPEIDIAKIKVGAEVEVTLDAYGKSVVFPATVTRINPTATTEGSVPVYKIIITFIGNDERIREGMTANVQVVTLKKTNTIIVPARFVFVRSETQGTVSVLMSGKGEEKEVVLGARGNDGTIEISRGLLDGDTLLPPVTTTREAQKKTN